MNHSLLTELRKRQALYLIEQGYSSRDVALRLGLAETTVQRLRQGRIAVTDDVDADDECQQRVWCERCRCHVYAPCQRCRLRDYLQRHGAAARGAGGRTAAPVSAAAGIAADPRLALGVAQLGLPVRTVNYLAKAGILTVYDLLQRTPGEILRLPNMGPGTLEAIFAALARLGFHRRKANQQPAGQRPMARRGSVRAADARPVARRRRK